MKVTRAPEKTLYLSHLEAAELFVFKEDTTVLCMMLKTTPTSDESKWAPSSLWSFKYVNLTTGEVLSTTKHSLVFLVKVPDLVFTVIR